MEAAYNDGIDKNPGLKDDSVYQVNNGKMVLEDIVNIKILKEIQNKFTQVTGVRCVITNTEGKPITGINNFTKFCKLIRSNPEGRRRCEECDRLNSLDSARKGEAIYYTCHAGLIDAAMPIVVNNQYIGSFLCGEVILPETKLDFDDIKMMVKDLKVDNRLLFNYLSEIEVVSKEKLIAALEMLTIMTNYIAEMGAANIAQKQLMAEMKAKAELENMLKETEYKALVSQINPHFLFNCLNTIGRVALTEEAYQTQELIYAISDILRSLLKHTEKIILIKEEIKYVRDYLAIQLARFGDRINVVFDLDEEVLKAKIPKFTLQPIVENAIIHGLEPKIEGGTLTIKAVYQDKDIIIDVIDTGVGIQDDKLRTLIKIKQEPYCKENVTNLGIRNVHQRIQYYFGQNYGLKIYSKPGDGCRVTIKLSDIGLNRGLGSV